MPGRKPLRIFAFPLAHLKSSSTPLIYYHVSQRSPIARSAESTTTSSSEAPPAAAAAAASAAEPPSSTVLTKPAVLAGLDYAQPSSWPDFMTHRASQFWLSFSQTQQEGPLYKTWKYKTWRNGERLMDKIEYEEWGLKNIDTGRDAWTGLKIVNKPEQTTSSEGEAEGRENGVENGKEDLVPKEKLLLIYPPLLSSSSPLALLRTHLTDRIPYHRQLLVRSSYLIPILLPIGLLPVIPNLPMFYVIWRMWSHWKAKRGAEYLLKLVDEGNVVEKKSEEFGRILVDAKLRKAGDEKAPDQTSSKGFEKSTASPEVKKSDQKMGLDGVPHSEKVDDAPDSTGTPKKMIYQPSADTPSKSAHATSSTSSISSSSSPANYSTAASTSPSSTSNSSSNSSLDKLIFPPSAIPIVAQIFELSPPEIVDLTRAVEQAGLRVKKEEQTEREG